ncbi:MAG: hypothetical protein ACI9WU_004004 [Myxococcota bacterium]|jgi:hypothetical protein
MSDGERAGRIADQMFLVMKTASSHTIGHTLTQEAIETWGERIREAGVPMTLQFVGGGLFRDKELVPLSVPRYRRVQEVAEALDHLGVHELTIDQVPSQEDLSQLAEAISQGSHGNSEVLNDLDLLGIEWRELDATAWGEEGETVDDSVFTATQIALAVADAELIAERAEPHWNWRKGAAIIRRIERAAMQSVEAAARAVELGEGEWGAPRRGVSAAFTTYQVLQSANVAPKVRRVVAHAALAMGVTGFVAGQDFDEAAIATTARLLASPDMKASGVPPHRLRVVALLQKTVEPAINPADGTTRPDATVSLMRLAYDLERDRVGVTKGITLTRGDLLTRAIRWGKKRREGFTVRMLLHALGEIPAGALVRLADGRLGHAMGAGEGGDPQRPLVIVGGTLLTPDQPVRLASGAEGAVGQMPR